jgi:IMP dehydrogenase
MIDSLCFDDVLLKPRYSDIESRSQVDISVKLEKPGFMVELKHPIVPANMATITGLEMARFIVKTDGLAIVHRFMPVPDQLAVPKTLEKELGKDIWNRVGLSIGVQSVDREAIDHFAANGLRVVCIDIAHGDSKQCVEMCQYIHEKYPTMFLIAGNVATVEGAKRLWAAGADACKIGIGSGALCTTRIQTGNGIPTFSATRDISECREDEMGLYENRYVIADGGIKNAGDVVKSLAAGANLVMCGSLFAGCDETPGTISWVEGKPYRKFVGSSTHKTSHIEGVEALVAEKGKASNVLTKILDGVKSGCSYQGAHDLNELRKNASFVRITNNGMIESHPHINGRIL